MAKATKQKGPAFVVEEAAIESLQLDPANARTHGERNLAAIQSSLEQFGQVEPILVQKSTRRVIAGHGRLEAMRALGMERCQVHLLDVDDARARALGVALNRSAELAEWDAEKLHELLVQIDADGIDVDSLGFTDEDRDELFADLDADGKEDDDDEAAADRPAKEQFNVLVICSDDREQRELLKRLTEENYECRALTS